MMSAITSDCNSLSGRQRMLNAAVNEAYQKKRTLDEMISSGDHTDIDTICTIDLASKYKNVDYIIEKLQSSDSLCVARALKACWLFTDNEYSHIINPTYVNTTLQTLMSEKAFSKFMSRLAYHVNDMKRCEEFYMHFVQMNNERYMKKFLLKCSIPFIKSRILMKDFHVTPEYLMLLSVKSQEILVAYIESECNMTHKHIYALRHLIDIHGDFYLDLLEKYIAKHDPLYSQYGQRVTREIIRNHKERIFKLPHIYLRVLHFKQLAYGLTQDEVKHLALLIAERGCVWGNDELKSLINLLPSEERYIFLQSMFVKFFGENFEMNQNFVTHGWYEYMSERRREEWALQYIEQRNEYWGKFYKWYKFVSFSKTFIEMKKLLRAEPDASERESMFEILVSTCNDNDSNIMKLLKYFHDRHINEIILFKQHIIERIMENKCIYKCGNEVWDVLNEILLSLRIYENENNCYDGFKKCAITHVIAHQIIYDKPITMKMFQLFEKHYSMLSVVSTTPWKEKVFNFLYKWLIERISEQNLMTSNCQNLAIKWINELIHLIEYHQYPVNPEVIGFIRKIREYNSNALSEIISEEKYKEFFPEEQPLPDEDICLQKLKKNVVLLDSYKAKFDAKIQSNTMRYRKFLSKIRIYFGKDLALKWRKYYLDKLKDSSEDSTGCASVLFGLSILLPAADYEELITQYRPENAKLVWSETDPCLMHIQSNIAKYMHLVRPVVNYELLISFAKGDFLQYTVNSVLSVSRQLTQEECREMIVKLLTSPVSVQKHGIRMAFKKFNMEELIDIFGKMWAKTENVSIRRLLFSSVHDMLIKTEDDKQCLATWKLLSEMVTQLHGNEFLTNIVNPSTRGLGNVKMSVRPQYCTAYWHLLQSVQECDDIWRYRNYIIETITDNSLLNLLDEEFLKSIILNFLQCIFHEGISNTCPYWYIKAVWTLIAKFVVRCETEEIAEQRKNDVLTNVVQNFILKWGSKSAETFRNFVRYLLTNCKDLLYTDKESFYNPVHVFEYIQKEINDKLTELEHYQYRLWVKFIVILVKSLSESVALDASIRSDRNHLWCEIFGKYSVEVMRSEVTTNYPQLPQLFGHYLMKFVYHECDYINRGVFYIGVSEAILKEKNDINFLSIVVELLTNVSKYCDMKAKADKLLNVIREMNISDLNHCINSKKRCWTPFSY